MKKRVWVLTVILIVIAIMSMPTVWASAANTEDEEFYSLSITTDGRRLYPREKDDASPHYPYITDGNLNAVQVTSFGKETYYEGGAKNVTCSNGKYVSHVTCRIGIQYSIHNEVYEQGFPWAVLEMVPVGYYGASITGAWSPDSTRNYTDA